MKKGELKNIRQMIESLTYKAWKAECLGHVLQNTLSGGEVMHKIEYGMLAGILNENIKQVLQKIDKLDRYFLRLSN